MDINKSTIALPQDQERFLPALYSSWASMAVLALLAYMGLCSFLRFKRHQSLKSQLGFADRRSLSRMTVPDAQRVMADITTLEFPLMYDLSLRFALIKTYAMDNVAKVLGASSDLAKPEHAPKRYEDTAIIYKCFATFEAHSTQFLKAVARMNYLHAPYVKSGKILNKDLLYVLYASMSEPVRFMRLFEWRALSDMEVAALGTVWKHVGDLMGIDYKEEVGRDQWGDGVEFMEDIARWAAKYEDVHLRPSEESKLLGRVMMDLLLTSYPGFMRPAGYQICLVLLGDRLRNAYGFPEPGIAITALAYVLLLVRKTVARHLCLPRLFHVQFFSPTDPSTGRTHQYVYMKEPWYVPGTAWSRWGPEAIVTRLSGGNLPGSNSETWQPEGFLFEDLGPLRTMGKGRAETDALVDPIGSKGAIPASPFWGARPS